MTVYYLLEKKRSTLYKIIGTWYNVTFDVIYRDLATDYGRVYEFFCVSNKIIKAKVEELIRKYQEKLYLVWVTFCHILEFQYEYDKLQCETDDIFKITLSRFRLENLYDTFRILYRYDEGLYRMEITMKDRKIESYLVLEEIHGVRGPIKGVKTIKSTDFIDLEKLRNIKTIKELHEKIVEV